MPRVGEKIMNFSLRQKTWIFITIVLVVGLIGILILTHYLYEHFYIEKQMDLLDARGDLLLELYFDEDTDEQEFLHRVEWMNRCAEANVLYANNL
ncbi:hypothetical protein KHA80_17430 [Anaerobacillus sp. HL2]|nr:hypothetical protein KHA80_17430 [Anaerobacillus sp. HL2]